MGWWLKNNLRLIQNNLRDIDVRMDVDQLIEDVKGFSCNVLMVGAGGITAFYPTKLEYHFRNPYLEKDILGEIVEKCHNNGIRVIARFDFSKTHESIFEKKPEWYYKSKTVQEIRYNDTVHTCVNGYYQQEYSLEIIKEVLQNYPVDGIFFNMFGFQTRDYSNNYHGICQCENCKRRFKEMYNLDLPEVEDLQDPVFIKYQQFKDRVVKEMLARIYDLTKGINPDIAVCTYHYHKVDIIRDESNSAVDRPLPFWLYSGSENCQSVENTWGNKISSNCVINAVDIFYRFMGVSKYLTRIRLLESMASGSGLDFCIIGVFDDYPDYDNFEYAKEVFNFHAKHEYYFGHMESTSDILIIRPNKGQCGYKEYLGIYKMFKEEHIIFDVACQENIDEVSDGLKNYRSIIIPDIQSINSDKFIDALLNEDINVIGINKAFTHEQNSEVLLEDLFGIKLLGQIESVRSAYLHIDNKKIFKSFPKRNWVYLDGDFEYMRLRGKCKGLLPLVRPSMYGPPERCFGHEVAGYNSVAINRRGARTNVFIPWQPGYLYYQHGYEDHKYILLDILDHIGAYQKKLQTNAPKNVEIFFDKCGEDEFMLQLINLSGFNGTTFFEPIPIYDINITLALNEEPKKIIELTEGDNPRYTYDKGLVLDVDELNVYKSYIIWI